eukprot:g38671.t1
MKQSLPELYTLTVCLWLKSKDTVGIGTPFSYAVPGQANELVLLEWGKNPIELLINDKDVAGGSFDATQAFVGELAEFNVWDRILTPMEIQNIANCSTSTVGNIISWEGSSTELFGGAT